MRLWGTIEKVTENDDGTLTVSGVASSEAVDADGEVITAAAMKDAIPDYMKFGALREMHQPIAAGTALSCDVQDDGRTYLEALVVDSESVKKVKAGVLKGFSIGGKVQKRNAKNKNIIEAIKLVEISLVDRPANPEAIIGLVKMEDTVDEPEVNPEVQPTPDNPAPENPPAPDPAPDVEKAQRLDIVKAWAGEEIMDASRALACLDALFWLWQKEAAEGEAAQAADLSAACARLRAFIAAEIMEDNSTLALAAGADGLEKKGAKFSKATKAALKAAQESMEAGAACLKALGYEDAEEEEEDAGKAAASEALAKAAGLEDELVKAHAERDEALQKAATIQKELDALKAMKPLKAVPIDKGAESTITKSEGAGAETTPTDPLSAMKAVHASGGKMITTTRLG